jgi:hypothetical protein
MGENPEAKQHPQGIRKPFIPVPRPSLTILTHCFSIPCIKKINFPKKAFARFQFYSIFADGKWRQSVVSDAAAPIHVVQQTPLNCFTL